MRILLVKLSSMGDVIHNLPVVSDLRRAFPNAIIDWVTESPYAALIGLHPDLNSVLPMHLRALKKHWWQSALWTQLTTDRAALALHEYDAVIDTQGLLKSAVVASWAHGPRYGMSRETVREPLATRFYDHKFWIDKNEHAVTRNRQLAAAAMGYKLNDKVDYGLSGKFSQTPRPEWSSNNRKIVFLHATSRADKQWLLENWVTLGKQLQALGFQLVLPWGSAAEKQTSEFLATQLAHEMCPIVPPVLSLTEAAVMLADAAAVIGVDTGLAHLAVALGRPTVGLYITTQPELTGLFGAESAINLRGGACENPANPSTGAVFAAIVPWIS